MKRILYIFTLNALLISACSEKNAKQHSDSASSNEVVTPPQGLAEGNFKIINQIILPTKRLATIELTKVANGKDTLYVVTSGAGVFMLKK